MAERVNSAVRIGAHVRISNEDHAGCAERQKRGMRTNGADADSAACVVAAATGHRDAGGQAQRGRGPWRQLPRYFRALHEPRHLRDVELACRKHFA